MLRPTAPSADGDGNSLPVIVVTGMAFEARIARGQGVEVVYAARADLLERALNAAVARGCSGIVSFGTAGGLAPDLQPGALIVADAVEGRLAAFLPIRPGRTGLPPRWRPDRSRHACGAVQWPR